MTDQFNGPTVGSLPFFDMVITVVEAISVAFFTALAGYFSAFKGHFPKDFQRHFSYLNVHLFTPALIFVKVANTVDASQIHQLWVLPVFTLFLVFVSYVSANVVSKWLRLPAANRKFVIACGVFQNSSSYPVALISTLAYTLPGMEWSKIPGDTRADVHGRGLLYLLVLQQIGQTLRWTWGVNSLLANPEKKKRQRERSLELVHDEQRQPLLADEESAYEPVEQDDVPRNNNKSCKSAFRQAYYEFAYYVKESWIAYKHFYNRHPLLHKIYNQMNAPTVTIFFSFFIAATPLRDIFFSKNSLVSGSLTLSIKSIADIAVPGVLLVLGASFFTDTSSLEGESPEQLRISKMTIRAAVVVRMLIAPIISMPFIYLFARYLKISIFDDPVFVIVMFLIASSPPAIQNTQLCQINQVFEKECALVLYWCYVFFTLPSSIISVMLAIKTFQQEQLHR